MENDQSLQLLGGGGSADVCRAERAKEEGQEVEWL